MGVDVSILKGTVLFTFQVCDVQSCKSAISCTLEPNQMPASGSMLTQIFDFNGVSKMITLKGALTTATVSRTSISGVATSTTIKTVTEQKKWLESLCSGSQAPMTFISNYETYSTSTAQTPSDSDPYASTFAATTIMVESIDFDEQAANVDYLPFTINLKVGTF